MAFDMGASAPEVALGVLMYTGASDSKGGPQPGHEPPEVNLL